MCVFVMSLYAMVSSAVIVSSNTKTQILVGRTIHCESSISESKNFFNRLTC